VVLSVIKDLASSFGFEGFREVQVRKVDLDEVGLDLVELRFKVSHWENTRRSSRFMTRF